MSLIIEGIEMPKDGRLLISIHSDGCVYRSVYDMGFEKVNSAKAKELPPHGSLIDTDTLKLTFSDGINEDGVLYVPFRDIAKSIENAPIIIEAEGERK